MKDGYVEMQSPEGVLVDGVAGSGKKVPEKQDSTLVAEGEISGGAEVKLSRTEKDT